jgi:type VI secretion system protein ImpF
VANDSLQYRGFQTREEARYKPFVLHRLTDDDPSQKQGGAPGFLTERQLKDDILENIRMLFNSRSHPLAADLERYPGAETSVLAYGISDYCGKKGSDEDIEALRLHIVSQLRCFEPRLAPDSIEVDFAATDDAFKTLLDFKIRGIISVGDAEEELLFLSKLDLETGCTDLEAL